LLYFLIPWYRPDLDDGRTSFRGLDFKAVGLPTMDEVVARYCARTGRASLDSLNFYCAFNLFRAAAIGEGIVARARQGNAAASDAASFEESVKAYAERGWQFAQGASA
jgi:aminoglycoside phosphotransferase (APT) family kinase protein